MSRLPKVVLRQRPRPNPSEQQLLEVQLPEVFREANELDNDLYDYLANLDPEEKDETWSLLLGSGGHVSPEGTFHNGFWLAVTFIATRLGYNFRDFLDQRPRGDENDPMVTKVLRALQRSRDERTRPAMSPEDLV
jgi:hypothetical protein